VELAGGSANSIRFIRQLLNRNSRSMEGMGRLRTIRFGSYIGCRTSTGTNSFTPPEVRARFELVSVSHGTFSRQAEVARWRILPGPDVDVHVESSVRFDIGFDDGGPGAGRPVLTTLGDIGMRVMHIIDGFANAVLPE
jgi:hypothetical protein